MASRLLHCLARDGLVPSSFASVSSALSTPWVATLFCGSVSTLAAGLSSTWLLSQAAGVGGVGAGVAGAAAVVARRYHPDASHALEKSHDPSLAELQQLGETSSHYSTTYSPTSLAQDEESDPDDLVVEWVSDGDPRELSVEWNAGKWVSTLVEPTTPPTMASWRTARFLITTFTVNSLAGAGVARISGLLGVWWTWPGAVLCAGGCLVCAAGVWIQPRHPPPPSGHHAPGMPLLPLASLLANSLLLTHLPAVALVAAGVVCCFSLFVWFFYGRSNSFEAVISRALLPRCSQAHPDIV